MCNFNDNVCGLIGVCRPETCRADCHEKSFPPIKRYFRVCRSTRLGEFKTIRSPANQVNTQITISKFVHGLISDIDNLFYQLNYFIRYYKYLIFHIKEDAVLSVLPTKVLNKLNDCFFSCLKSYTIKISNDIDSVVSLRHRHGRKES